MNASAAQEFARPAVLTRGQPQLTKADALIALTVLMLAQSPVSAIVCPGASQKTEHGHLRAEDFSSALVLLLLQD